MNPTCKYCEKPITGGIEMFGGSPLHPECYDELQSDMDEGFGPVTVSVLDLEWGGHPTERILDEVPF